jgi:hypothetical protein
VKAEELLAAVRRLVERPDVATAGVWRRAAALLARQALELALAGLWAARPAAAGLDRSSMRSQLLCLTAYLDGHTATRAACLYAALSRACHHHLYALAPTATELTRWLNETTDLVKAPARAITRPVDSVSVDASFFVRSAA